MKTFEYTISDPDGIHARPAGLLVKEASKYKSTITLSKDGTSADLKRIFSVMSLAVKEGDTVTVQVTGPDENPAIEAMKTLFSDNL